MRFARLAAPLSLALTLLTAPLAAEAQPAGKVDRIGLISFSFPVSTWRTFPHYKMLLQDLRELGHVEGQNLVIEFRSAEGKLDRLPSIAAELVRLHVDVIVVPICGDPLNAVMRATSTIPIVVQTCQDDMVATGVVRSLAHPGGNVTGIQKSSAEAGAKRLQLLKEAVPKVSRVAVLWNPAYADWSADWRELRTSAKALRVSLQSVEARSVDELDRGFETLIAERVDGLISFSDSMAYANATRVAQLLVKSRLPSISPFAEIPAAGGLMSYGPNALGLFRHSATFVHKILQGAKPADLPVEQPTKFELVINLKTAKALGLTIPPSVLARADEVIE